MFLDEKIMELYDAYMRSDINMHEFRNKHAEAVGEKMNSDPTLVNLKRVVNSLNLAVDNIKKKYGYSILKKISYKELYEELFNPAKT